MKYEQLANDILTHIGGRENVASLTHCITRLRFQLKDDSIVDKDKVKNIDGVVSCVNKGGQFQVVIGTHVEDVYHAVCKVGKIEADSSGEPSGEKKGLISAFFDTIAGIFVPIIGALAGAGMLKAILSLATTFNWVSPESQTYTILFMVSDIAFYYMPFFLAVSAAKKFKTNTFLALIFAGMLVHPTLIGLKDAGDAVALLGIPMRMATYTSSVIPIILIVYFQSYIERFAKKITPQAVKTFLVPIITILIVAPVGLLALGPIGAFVGEYVAAFFNLLNEKASWVVPTLVGALNPLLVMTGMHYSVGAAQAVQRATVGYATIYSPGALASNMSQAAAVFAVSIKSKKKDITALASSCAATAICGITEPALYGVTLKLKRPLYATMLAGGIAGFYAGIMGVKAYSAGTSTIFTLPIYIGQDNSFIHACITAGIAIVLGFVFSYLFHKDEEAAPVEEEVPAGKTNVELNRNQSEVYAPIKGEVVALENVKDDAFSTMAMGKGIAIEPTEGIVYAPFDGKVEVLFKTKHAIGLRSNEGVELLIHIGIDTVKLEGKHFEALVSVHDTIKQGQELIRFNISEIKQAGYDCITPIIITNTGDYLDVIESDKSNVGLDNTILTAIK
ncbi:beta-glucoside-specific PTS transporter subunit IIABC [Amphibacillus sediminis]|uniref:beta-glucoside-specific PTS transporter subunit IIABC n=1 Tax=Amphibacillus sediminis TaxID=360185 RepID=UPI0008348723|nr:beta-glucoside-specific PTS transporter subunit IIABC [Amphibacillus sediminis]